MNYVGAVVGGVIGAYAGGVSGAIYGAEIGYSIGSVIQASNAKTTVDGPRLSDVRVTFSSNGIFIPRYYVYVGGVGGNIIDGDSNLKATPHVTETSSGKGGPTTVTKTTSYSGTLLVLLCKSIGDRKVVWIKANGNLIWSRVSGSDGVTIVASQGLVGNIIVYDGNPDQLPDPTLEALHGIGNVSGYRGRLCVMFVDFQLENFSNNIEATLLTFGIAEGAGDFTISTLNELAPAVGLIADAIGPLYDGLVYWVFAQAGGTLTAYRDLFDGTGLHAQGAFLTSDYFLTGYSIDSSQTGLSGCPAPIYVPQFMQQTSFTGVCRGDVAAVYIAVRATHVEAAPYTVLDTFGNPLCEGETRTIVDDGVEGPVTFYEPLGRLLGTLSRLAFHAFYIAHPPITGFSHDPEGLVIAYAGKEHNFHAYAEICGTSLTDAHSLIAFSSGDDSLIDPDFPFIENTLTFSPGVIVGLLAANGKLYILVAESYAAPNWTVNCHVIDIRTAATIATWAGPTVTASFLQRFDLFLIGADLFVNGVYLWSWDDSGVLTTQNITGASPGDQNRVLAYNGSDYALYTEVTASSPVPGGRIQTLKVRADTIDPNITKPWSEVIAEIAAEKGVTTDTLDFTLLPDSVVSHGYMITRQASPRVAIDVIRDLIRVDIAESGSKIKFVLRGGDTVASLDADKDLGAMELSGNNDDPPQAVQWAINDELTQPRSFALKFADRTNNFEPSTAIARRETTPSQVDITSDATAFMLSPDEAAQAAEQGLTDQRLAAETAKWATTYKWELMETADPVDLPGKFKRRRVRVDSKTDKGGVIEWGGTRDDPASLTQFVKGGPASNNRPTANSILIAPFTNAEIGNWPSLRPNDDDSGFYIFLWPNAATGFTGALAYDQTNTSPREVGAVRAPGGARGVAVSVLPDFTDTDFDSGGYIDVQFPADVSLISTTPERMYGGECIYASGGEIYGALTATSLGSGLWRLHGGLLRGLRGTEAARATHTVGEAVYWLTTGGLLRDRNGSATTRGAAGPVSIGAVSIGRSTTDLDLVVSGNSTAQALIAFAPTNFVTGLGVGTTQLFTWMRRARKIPTDDFNVPLDDGTDDYQFQTCNEASFDTADLLLEAVTGEEWSSTRARPYYARVAQIGGDLKPGAFTAPLLVS